MKSSYELKKTLLKRLSERCTFLRDGNVQRRSFVLYWVCNAARGHDNPALDTAVYIANRLSIPVLVYHGLSAHYPFASDRHHYFFLEGARALQAELQKRNIAYVFHLETDSTKSVSLKILGNMSSMIITEDFPTPPLRNWRERLLHSTDVPMWSVDASCILPMTLSTKVYTHAFRFREDFKEEREKENYTRVA